MNTKIATLMIILGLGLGACAQAPVRKDVGQLNLTYATKAHGNATGRAVGIISQVGAVDATTTMAQSSTGLALNQNLRWNARADLAGVYIKQLGTAMGNAFVDMLSQRGFNIKGPFTSLDELTFGEKRDTFLVSNSKLQLDVAQKSTRFDCSGGVCTDEGEFQVAGELNIALMEPMTQQSVMTRRIDLSAFNISKHYRKMTRQPASPNSNLLLSAIQNAGGPEQLVDDTDKVMTEALNEFFAKAMAKIDNLLSREEILAHEPDVTQLKGMKRF